MRPIVDMDDTDNDHMLVRRAANGDRNAFCSLMERHYDRVFRVAFTVLSDEGEAEDVAQEIWCALPAKLRHWRGDAAFTTWLHTITMNAARDALRRAATRRRAVSGYSELSTLARDEAADTEGRLHWLRTALKALGAELQETAALILAEDMTHAQAAEILGVSEGTISWRMSEIRKRLREAATEQPYTSSTEAWA